jgi:predicted MFS family arabinose efflux permease
MNKTEKSALRYATIVAMGGFIFGLDAALIAGTVDAISGEFSLSPPAVGHGGECTRLGRAGGFAVHGLHL